MQSEQTSVWCEFLDCDFVGPYISKNNVAEAITVEGECYTYLEYY